MKFEAFISRVLPFFPALNFDCWRVTKYMRQALLDWLVEIFGH